MRPLQPFLIRALVAFVLLGAHAAGAEPFRFIALGDLPYGPPAQSYAPYRKLIATVNRLAPTFTIHVGDIKSGSTRCSDEEFAAQREHFGMYAGAVVYTPGDNEWTDCHRPNNGGYDPLERLDTLRRMFFVPGRSLGQAPLALENQSIAQPAHARFVENQRWLRGGVLFVTLHMVGSNNNFEPRDARAVAEFMERERANIAWIQEAFELARRQGARALVFAMQADVFEVKSALDVFPGHSGFRASIGQTLIPLAARAPMPVLLIHGDSHRFLFDQPFSFERKPVTNLSRLIVPGETDVRAVEVEVDGSRRQPFAVRLIEAE